MAYIEGVPRGQFEMFPPSLEDFIGTDNPVRLIDAFVGTLDMAALGFKRPVPKATGAPGYDPRDLLKLYIYAYLNKIRSSRLIAAETARNIEVMWLIEGLTPDFRTIADFRKDNASALKGVFRQWNSACLEIGLFSGSYVSIDGSKFKGVNSKDRNFTLSKLDDRLSRIDGHIEEFLGLLDRADSTEEDKAALSAEDIKAKIEKLKARKLEYLGLRDGLEQTGQRQVSLSDPEARLMKFKSGFEVGYNVQTAVDSTDQMIAGFLVTDHATDHGLLKDVVGDVLEGLDLKSIDAAADKGYQSAEDMAACLEAGIVPNVFPAETGGTFTLEVAYEPAAINDGQKASLDPQDIQECLRAGVVPDIYEGIISSIEIATVKCRQGCQPASDPRESLDDELLLRRANEGYFVHCEARGKVYCPAGHTLRPKSVKKDGSIRYANKLACKGCKMRCTKSEWKEIDFAPGKAESACPNCGTRHTGSPAKPIAGATIKKAVRFIFHPDANKLARRMSLSEHPFGTIKRSDGASYLLLKGKLKVTGELALSFLSYNIRRAINIKGGVAKLIAEMGLAAGCLQAAKPVLCQ